MKKYPFKFLDAYDKEDKNIFFGREEEIDELYRLVFQTNLLLVYGASGTGKTSLIRCGLSNRFKASQWLDLNIRRGTDINQSLLDTIVKYTPVAVAAASPDDELDWFENMMSSEQEVATPSTDTTPIESDHPVAQALEKLYLATFTPIYLIFDQFEELYTLGQREEQVQFTQTIEALVQLPLPVKIIIVMREEYLARLYNLERAVPQLRNKKLRIEPMDLPRVEQIILRATSQNPQSNISLEQGQEATIAKAIIDKIREGDVNIKLPYLQVFMDRLYEKATGLGTDRSQAAHFELDLVDQMGNIGDVLAEFIELQSKLIHQHLSQKYKELPKDIVWQLLSPFATIDGTKVPIRQQSLATLTQAISLPANTDTAELIRSAISELENSRILRYRKEEDTYEVAHETLALQIAEKRSEEEKANLKAKRMIQEGFATYQDTKTLLSREQLAFIRPYQSRLQTDMPGPAFSFIQQSTSQRRRQQIFLWSGIIALLATAIIVIIYILGILSDFRREQAGREKTELNTLLQNAEQIAKGQNCPPPSMQTTIDSLHSKHQTDTALHGLYLKTMEQLQHCK